MVLSFACAFVIPLRMTNPVRAQFQNIFAPVSRPVGSLAHWMHGKLVRPERHDARDALVIEHENDRLKTSVANLQAQVRALQEITAERQLLGDVLPLCTPVTVVGIGTDAGNRESLSLQSTEGVQDGMFALYSGGIVGRIDRAGFSVQGSFGRFVTNAQGQTVFQTLKAPAPLVQGAGKGEMVIKRLAMEELTDVRPGDWVVVDDRDWPQTLHGYKLGVIESKEPAPGAPLFAELRVRPMTTLTRLNQVMVMTKASATPVREAKTE
jgi:hypothetical protein